MEIFLLIAGVLIIGAIFAHGLKTIRSQGQAKMKTKAVKPIATQKDKDTSGFDDDGIGEVRVVAKRRHEPKMEQMDLNLSSQAEAAQEAEAVEPAAAPEFAPAAAPEPEFEQEPQVAKAPGSEVSEPEAPFMPSIQAEQAPEPEPELAPEPQDVLVLHVVAKEDEPIEGAELLPLLLTLGMRFGEMDIFHRHKESSGRGPVLFSMANMVNPGTFDVDNMEQFNTRGVALFMTLPNAGDAMKAFAMMLSAAQKMAEEFGCQVLDGDRNLVTQQTVQHYQGQIREFTRRQLLAAGGH
ncbi:cell division protein ZipA [Gallaecimonas pentaromativorans]|uniref:Cell division protein ZipA n=1 Tax=Gallaecimonas pentaromativorans TaxID=584787 RepID=A0A3N1PMU7_9GAMM|nr:cell division protein ZipA [Gallaecimonas pentaromativorans]ROQ30025.1 cell division protein ZipA [Gallaecimonas pentaromativorans]